MTAAKIAKLETALGGMAKALDEHREDSREGRKVLHGKVDKLADALTLHMKEENDLFRKFSARIINLLLGILGAVATTGAAIIAGFFFN